MTRNPASRRPQPVSADDAVVARVVEATAWTRQNSRAVIIGLIVVAILVFAGIYYANYRRQLESRATTELLELRQLAASGDIPAAVTQLEGFVERFEGTPATAEARLLLAQLQLAQGNAAQAADAIRPVAAETDEPLMSASAGLLLAGAYESAGQPDQAIQAYLRVAETAELEFQQREALEDAARIHVQQGDPAAAVELYDRLIGMTEDGSAERDVYEMRRAEVTAGN